MSHIESMEQFSSHHRSDYLAMGAAAVLGAGSFMYSWQNQATKHDIAHVDDRAQYTERQSDKGSAYTAYFVGQFQHQQSVEEQVGHAFEPLGPAYFIRNSSDVEQNRELMLEIAEKQKGRDLVVFNMSKGGIDFTRMVQDLTFVRELGHIALLTNDSAPMITDHITEYGKKAAIRGLSVPENHLTSMLFTAVNKYKRNRQGSSFVRDTSDRALYKAMIDARVLMSTVADEDIMREALSEQHVGQMMMVASQNDRFVDTNETVRWVERVSGRKMHNFTDPKRIVGSHAEFTTKPDFHIHLIKEQLAGNLDPAPLTEAA